MYFFNEKYDKQGFRNVNSKLTLSLMGGECFGLELFNYSLYRGEFGIYTHVFVHGEEDGTTFRPLKTSVTPNLAPRNQNGPQNGVISNL